MERKDFGLTADEEAQLARECLRLGKYPREVRIARTGTIYQINSRKEARRLLGLLGIEA